MDNFQRMNFSIKECEVDQVLRLRREYPCCFTKSANLWSVQAEPYLHSGMGQVSFYQEALKNFFSKGVDLNRYKDT